jgi:hypothetical protein
MKYLAGILFSLFLIGPASAANLCDSSCELSVSFPDGGSIEAVKDLTITFGDGGYINNGSVVTGYSAGDVVTLSAGESIDFQANGEFQLGNGNIDYSDVLIISNGVMQLAAVDGQSKVYIHDMTLLGEASLNISSDFEVVEGGAFHIFSGPVTASSDLVFVNNGSVSGMFVFDNATMSIEEENYQITGAVLIEADRLLTMESVQTSYSDTTEIVIATIPKASASVDEGGAEDGVDNSAAASTSDSASTSASASGGSGMIGIASLFGVALLLSVGRFKSFRF